MTPRSWESWTNPLDRREELNVTVFFSSNRHRLKKCRMCQQDISWNCNGIFLSFYFFVDGEGCVASYSYVALSISYKLPIKDYTSNKSAFVFIRFGFFFFQFVFFLILILSCYFVHVDLDIFKIAQMYLMDVSTKIWPCEEPQLFIFSISAKQFQYLGTFIRNFNARSYSHRYLGFCRCISYF